MIFKAINISNHFIYILKLFSFFDTAGENDIETFLLSERRSRKMSKFRNLPTTTFQFMNFWLRNHFQMIFQLILTDEREN